MKLLSIDVETTISNKGNPFDSRNKCVSVAWTDGNISECVRVGEEGTITKVQDAIDNCDLLVGFNIKFDLHWLRNLGLHFTHKRVYDCQVAEYTITRQRTKYPSLANTLSTYSLEGKLDLVKEEYWSKGIDTDEIPWEILSAYNIIDVEQTLKLYHCQQTVMKPIQKRLVQLCCDDLLTLQEMEYNGIPIDLDKCNKDLIRLLDEIGEITNKLGSRYPHIPINFNSTDDLSAYLYGGSIEVETRVIAGLFKSGAKTGQPRFKVERQTYQLEGLVRPIKDTELVKEGLWSTSEQVLRKLKDKTGTVELLLRLAKLTKVKEFYESFIQINKDMNWEENKIHGQFNQVSTWTGRLSSTKPNLQNMCPEIQENVRSLYG